MRATSSVKSAWPSKSARQDGGLTSKVFSLTSHPMVRKILTISAGATSTPIMREMYAGSTFTIGLNRGSPATTVATCCAGLFSVNNCTKRAEAYCASEGSTLRSKRREASDESLWRREFLATQVGSNRTASSAISVVVSDISENAPPIVPASASGCSSSQTIRSSGSNWRT